MRVALARLVAWLRPRRSRPAPLSEDQLDELERQAEFNAASAARRSESAAIYDRLVTGRSRWLAPRSREKWKW